MRDLNVAESDLIREELPECEVTADNLDKVKELLEWAQARDAAKKDCACVASSQIGMKVRALAYFDPKKEEWIGCLNPYITETTGEAKEVLRSIINLPKSYVRTRVFPECVFEFDNVMGQPEKKILRGDAAVLIQFLCKILDGKMPEVLRRDFRTVRREEPRRGPNEKCGKCGRKLKRCICERTTDGDGTSGHQQPESILPEAWGGQPDATQPSVEEDRRVEERQTVRPDGEGG
jgi:hypothetical protein